MAIDPDVQPFLDVLAVKAATATRSPGPGGPRAVTCSV